MPEGKGNVLLNDRDMQIVEAIRNLVKVTDEAMAEYGMMRIDMIPTEVHDRINAVHDDFITLLGYDPKNKMADIQVFIETVDLFHRAVPRKVVEEVWAHLMGPMVLMNAMQGAINPITIAESMHRLISALKIDQDGWVEGLEGEA